MKKIRKTFPLLLLLGSLSLTNYLSQAFGISISDDVEYYDYYTFYCAYIDHNSGKQTCSIRRIL